MQTNNIDTVLNNREITSILALVSYVAYAKNCAEDTVVSLIQQYLKIDNINSIQADDYDKTIRFLIEMAPATA